MSEDYDIRERRASMRRDILSAVMKRTESRLEQEEPRVFHDDNPMYEDPRDVIGDKPAKPPRKRNIQAVAVSSPKTSKESRTLLREQKKKLTKKYESLITSLMERCEENVTQLSERDSQINKLKEKLKIVLEYNRLFAEENDQLKSQYETLVKYVEECKAVIKEERERNTTLEEKKKELENKVKQYEVPDRDNAPTTAIPLVEVCMSCSSRQIILNQAREQNTRLQKDMQALKDVLYRLNVQLSRYQEKLRANVQGLSADGKDSIYKPGEKIDGFDSLITASLGYKQESATDEAQSNKTGPEEQTHGRVVDLSGLLSAQALAPLFDAYQENLQEKDSLILDYEKQFENINKKSKQIVTENKSLNEKVRTLEEELAQTRQNYKKMVVERETADIEKATLAERAERAESKLKEVYELYEDKMAAMMRDYETVHREYFATRGALEAADGRLAAFAALRARTVPADLHERRLDHCKRLLEELKHQYSMETERKTEQAAKLQEQLKLLEEKHSKVCQEHEAVKEELTAALKNVRLYRKAAVIFRQRVKAATARATRVRRSVRKARTANEPLRLALEALERIKREIKVVKSRAYSSLEELERRIVQQERRAALAHAEHRRELDRAALALQHKEGIIRSLIDKVADVEEVRLSQTNTSRLQGIVSDVSDHSSSPEEKKDTKPSVKLVPGAGGYFQEKEGRRKRQRNNYMGQIKETLGVISYTEVKE
ncbi:protein Cep89 homolog isoform X2 [Galleria mellonella]|uniref:Protein Cep89 homolog isoform X2 n=1 Tax=Galleria mellonella TaxID=7137 RepID=A0A6J1WC37_GALME|nr:protein Cep89 homolog isoform X2 [Galleria mellonella]